MLVFNPSPTYPHIPNSDDELPSLFDGDLFVSIEECDALDTISAESIGQRLADIMVCNQSSADSLRDDEARVNNSEIKRGLFLSQQSATFFNTTSEA